jgi:hypothetical protein
MTSRNKAMMSSMYVNSMTRYIEYQFTAILDEVISGRRKGALDIFIQQLQQLGNKGQFYFHGLQTTDAMEFNDLLVNALADIAFHISPAIEV